jgi:periplasmic protein TonB
LLSGLAYKVIRHPPRITTVEFPIDQPPPPPPHPVETQRNKLPTPPIPTPPQPQTDELKSQQTQFPLPPLPGPVGTPSGGGMEMPQPLPAKPNLARDVVPGADRLRWITTDDYPATALRQGIQGTVVISAMIGADGKVRSCVVMQSSGSQLLDDTTCRLYARRGHFTPARDADGNAIPAQRTDRFRWQIPNE